MILGAAIRGGDAIISPVPGPPSRMKINNVACRIARAGDATSLATVFLVATAVSLVGFVLTWLLPERPLRATLAADRALKGTTVTDDRGIVTQLVLGFAAMRREAA